MVETNNLQPLPQTSRPRSWSWLLTSGAGLCLAGLVGFCLWLELTQTVEAMIDAGESTAVVASNGLPVDAPAISVARVKEQETQARDAAVAASVLVFKDWNYTQASSSPFSFGDSTDSFNPLFAFDFNQQNQNNSPLFGNNGGTTPFGMSNGGASTTAVTTVGSGGSTTIVSPAVPTGNGLSVDPTFTVPGLNGLTINITININFNFGPLFLGREGFTSNHLGLTGISITITIQFVSPSS